MESWLKTYQRQVKEAWALFEAKREADLLDPQVARLTPTQGVTLDEAGVHFYGSGDFGGVAGGYGTIEMAFIRWTELVDDGAKAEVHAAVKAKRKEREDKHGRRRLYDELRAEFQADKADADAEAAV